MRRALALLLLAAPPAAQSAYAATYTVPALTSASIQSTMNTAAAAGAGNTVLLPAGLYNISSSISVPCGITVTGPVATPAVAILNPSFNNADIFTMGGCTGNTFQYLQFKNTGGLYANGTTLNITVVHNQFYGLPSSAGGASSASAAVYIDGYPNTATNWTIMYNTFGDANSCTAVFARAQDDGGYCVGIYEQVHGFISGVVQYNTFNHVEEGLHWHQQAGDFKVGNPQSWVDGGSIQYNYFFNFHRIAVEIQTGVINHTITVADNVYQNPLNVNYGTFAISMACCNAGSQQGQASGIPNPAQHTDANLIITNSTVVQIGPQQTFNAPSFGIEFWGGVGSTADGNYVEGPWNLEIAWGYGVAPWYIRNNYICATPPTPTGTGSQLPFYIYNEEGQSNPPIQLGNTTALTCTQHTSTAPTLTPGVAFSTTQSVTMADAGRNHSIWYTTDGSNPVPGAGTAKLYTGPVTLTATTTVKAVGMFGVPPQPTSYPAPYGFTPSAVVSATYTKSGSAPTLTGVTISLPSASLSAGGAGETATAQDAYSDGTHYDVSTAADPYGAGPVTFASTDPTIATITAGPGPGAGLITPIAAGGVNITATLGVLHDTTPLAIASSGAPPTLVLGQPLDDVNGTTYPNAFNSVYFVTTATTNGNICHLKLNGPVSSGKHYDCLLIVAPTPTTQASTYTCKGTYTTSGTAAPGTVAITMTGCPSPIPAGNWWLATITDDPAAPIAMRFYDCGSPGACQTTTAPTSGAGTYKGFWASITYGSYGSLPSTFGGTNTNQPTQWMDLTAAAPTLLSAYQANIAAVNSLVRGSGAQQQHAYCVYDDHVILQCDFPTSGATDARGSKVTAWSEISSGIVLTIGAAGATGEGLVTPLNYGYTQTNCTVSPGSIPCSPYTWYIGNIPATADSFSNIGLSGVTF